MTNSSTTIAFVVATRDRPKEIRTMLRSLETQSCLPDQIIIVDASIKKVQSVVQEFPSLNISYIHHIPPSASAQRNAGILSVGTGIDLVGFLDDDVVLEPGAIEVMLRFWKTAPADLGGCGFNLKNFVPTGGEWLKHSNLARWLGLYTREKGIVMPSGWQTMIGEVSETIFVQWLPVGASLWRKTVLENFRFEEYFEGYSYLEDLDFTYSVSRAYRLAVVAEAGFYHYHSPSGRISMYDFGKKEVANRLFFVRKHGLSRPRCYGALLLRLMVSLWLSLKRWDYEGFRRVLGNCSGIITALRSRQRSITVASTREGGTGG